MKMHGRTSIIVEVGGIFYNKKGGCLALIDLARVPRVSGGEGSEDGVADDEEDDKETFSYLCWVFLGLSQLLDRWDSAEGKELSGEREVFLMATARDERDGVAESTGRRGGYRWWRGVRVATQP